MHKYAETDNYMSVLVCTFPICTNITHIDVVSVNILHLHNNFTNHINIMYSPRLAIQVLLELMRRNDLNKKTYIQGIIMYVHNIMYV